MQDIHGECCTFLARMKEQHGKRDHRKPGYIHGGGHSLFRCQSTIQCNCVRSFIHSINQSMPKAATFSSGTMLLCDCLNFLSIHPFLSHLLLQPLSVENHRMKRGWKIWTWAAHSTPCHIMSPGAVLMLKHHPFWAGQRTYAFTFQSLF